MKYAIIADVHGNYPALRAVLEDAGEKGITRFLFTGDYCISGPWPEECVSAIREIEDKTVIRGNEEKYLEDLRGKDPAGWTDGQMQASYYAFRNLSPENREYLLAQPHRADLEICGVPVHMAHSSVDFNGTRAFYTWNSVTVAERSRLPGADPEQILAEMRDEREKDPEFLEAASGLERGIYIFGHSHIQWS
ncbi:MAG: metallophosphoesterase family protein, partial [Clostridia bacterium]|nr:metallophosphoesterase family protein [Clostridia bacterium]